MTPEVKAVEDLNLDRYSKAEWHAIRRLALTLAYGMLSSGAETYRIEETAQRILEAYGAVQVDVFAIANFLSISFETPSGREYYAQKRVHTRADNLNHVARLNSYTRQICATTPDANQALLEVREILNERRAEGLLAQVLITGYVGFGFALMLGAGIKGAIFAFFVDMILRLIIFPLQKWQANRLFINMIGGFIVTLLAGTAPYFGLGDSRSIITAASFMYLFPGISLMNSIRDIISNDLVAGLSKLLETLLAALSIAIGSGLVLGLEHLLA
ncbi:MAG: threonine/serine exporter family protein [Eubacteriales bacterium]|nr:threonine/serine exporter family protein [Eubacteriales bacterium]